MADTTTCCGHRSDCAVHNGPAYEPGPCDCGTTAPPCEGEPPTPAQDARTPAEIAREIVDWAGGPPTHLDPESSCEFALAAKIQDALIAHAEAARNATLEEAAREIDTCCGMDSGVIAHSGMSCARRGPVFPVRHESACRREDADAIRALAAPSEGTAG